MLLVTPVLFSIARFPYLQGRYLLPMWAGLLLVAGAATEKLPEMEQFVTATHTVFHGGATPSRITLRAR